MLDFAHDATACLDINYTDSLDGEEDSGLVSLEVTREYQCSTVHLATERFLEMLRVIFNNVYKLN